MEARGICHFDKLFRNSVPHILENIFFSLDYKSFEKSSVVSTAWNELLTSERFQKLGKSVFREDMERDLWRAVKEDDTCEARKIVSTGMVDVNCEGDWRRTPLCVAAMKGHKEMVQLLLERGAEINVQGDHGLTPLYLASQNNHSDIVKMLLDGGAKPNMSLEDGETPIHTAALKGHKVVVQLLLDRGAELNVTDDNGLTPAPLYMAVSRGHKDVVKLLLKRGAEPNIANVYGNTPLWCAQRCGFKDIANILKERLAWGYTLRPRPVVRLGDLRPLK